MKIVVKWCLACFYLAGFGCEASKHTATLTGTVKLDDKLLDHGSVLFVPSGGTRRNAAAGDIRPDGTYIVQIGQSEELIAGEYVVEIISREPSAESLDGGPPVPGASITPLRYSDFQTSELRYNVRPGENIIDILLVSDASTSTPIDHEEATAPQAVSSAAAAKLITKAIVADKPPETSVQLSNEVSNSNP